MKLSKKSGALSALLLLSATFNTHKTHTMEPISEEPTKEPTWQDYTAYIGDILLGDIELIADESSRLIQLPLEMKSKIISLLFTYNRTNSLSTCGKTINAIAQVNRQLNEFINNPHFCLKLIKHLAQKFKCSDQEAAAALQTKESKHRLDVQTEFLNVCNQENFNKQKFDLLYEKYKGYVDLNFTFYVRGCLAQTLLIQATKNNNCPAIQTILEYGANINEADSGGATALMNAALDHNVDTVKCLLNNSVNIIIDQQDKDGLTALSYALTSTLSINELKLVVKLLLDAGADPEHTCYTYNIKSTPLQDAKSIGNQELIDIIQDAIRKKHEEQGK